jgi:hypothetical protein
MVNNATANIDIPIETIIVKIFSKSRSRSEIRLNSIRNEYLVGEFPTCFSQIESD